MTNKQQNTVATICSKKYTCIRRNYGTQFDTPLYGMLHVKVENAEITQKRQEPCRRAILPRGITFFYI